MKIRYLMASMLACLVGFSSCGSDGDEPANLNKEGTHKLVVNVESSGTFKQALEEKLPECISIVGESHFYSLDTLVINGKINATDIHVLHNYKEEFTTLADGWDSRTIALDFSNAQIVGSDYKGKSYKANHLYRVNGNRFGMGFYVIKYPQKIEVIEVEALKNANIYDHSILTREELQEVEDRAFYDATIESTKPLNLEFSKNLKKIGKEAYAKFGGAQIKSLKISHDITIGSKAFAGSAAFGTSSIDLKGIEKIGNESFMSFTSRDDEDVIVSMPDVKYIGNSAFAFTSSAHNINPEDLKNLIEIGDSAFFYGNYNYSGKRPIDLSKANQLTKIGKSAFGGIYNGFQIDSFIIPNSVKEIGSGAFSWYDGRTVHIKYKTPPIYHSTSVGDNPFGTRCITLYVPKGCKNIYMKGAKETPYGTIELTCGIQLIPSSKVIEE